MCGDFNIDLLKDNTLKQNKKFAPKCYLFKTLSRLL